MSSALFVAKFHRRQYILRIAQHQTNMTALADGFPYLLRKLAAIVIGAGKSAKFALSTAGAGASIDGLSTPGAPTTTEACPKSRYIALLQYRKNARCYMTHPADTRQ